MGFVGAEVTNGLGRHRYFLEPGAHKKFLKYDWLDWAQVFLTLMFCKISICLFLLRLSNFRRLRLGLYALIAFLVTSHIPLFFLILFQCSPVSKYWRNPLEGSGTCFSKETLENIIIIQGDHGQVLSNLQYWQSWRILLNRERFYLRWIPRRAFVEYSIGETDKSSAVLVDGTWDRVSYRQQWSRSPSITLLIDHSTGIICIVRTAFSSQVKSMDVTWDGIPNALARILEINLGIIAACSPIMKPLIRFVRAKLTGHDPHDILYRLNTPSMSQAHPSWYARFKLGSRKFGSTSNKSGPWKATYNPPHNPPHNAPYNPPPRQTSRPDLVKQQSLGLPLQGPRVERHFEGDLGHLHKQSERSLQSDIGLSMEVQDRV
ncbi:MAG: hypothetical protein Q9174_005334 [Haloplaca sp. 1 TL-2023]